MSLLLLIGLRHLKLCTQLVCASPSPAGSVPTATLALIPMLALVPRLAPWVAGLALVPGLGVAGSRARSPLELADVLNGGETPALDPHFWSLQGWSN